MSSHALQTVGYRQPVLRGPALPDVSDIWFICRLLEQRAPGCLPLSHADVRKHLSRYVVLRYGGAVVASAAVIPLDAKRAELRSLAVDPGFSGQGLASHLVFWAIARAAQLGRALVCVTDKEGFFARLGFTRIPLDSVPEKPLRTRIPANGPRVAMEWRRTPGATPEVPHA